MRPVRIPRRLGIVVATVTSMIVASLVALPASGETNTSSGTAGVGDHVLYWNEVVLQAHREILERAPGPESRLDALTFTAIYDAANSALCDISESSCIGDPYLVKLDLPGADPNVETAIDYAAFTALSSVIPVYPQLNFQDELAKAQAGIPASPARDAGRQLGIAVGKAAVANRIGDGFPDNSTYTPILKPGYWRPTGTGPAATPSWGRVRPWVLRSGSQFRPPGPAGFESIPALLPSSAYAANYNEVKVLGERDSTVRTADQTEAAFFWANDLPDTYGPPGQLLDHTQIVSELKNVSQAGNARLFALVSLALADAAITAWDRKYLTDVDLWRPETAIPQGNTDNNPATIADPTWIPLAQDTEGNPLSPPFPAYTSGHATFGGAWQEVMRSFFGTDNVVYTGTTDDPLAAGVTRTFHSFNQAAWEDAISRIWLGVHFRFDGEQGFISGSQVGQYVVRNAL